ncbi:TonB-dependent receptor plug domain-containing protein, partial [Stenotrophomonas maltophilia]
GTQRTLVLVNGRRFVSSNTASIFGPVSPGSQVDLNNIPTTLVQRIETVAIGGAPIYGSDAIAGTVNII